MVELSKERERLAKEELKISKRETAFEMRRRDWADAEAKWCASALHHDNNEARNEVLRTTLGQVSGFDEELLRESHLEVRTHGESLLAKMAQSSASIPSKDVAPFGSRKSLAVTMSAPDLQTCDARVPFGSRKSVALQLPSALDSQPSLDMDSVNKLYRSMGDWDLTPLAPFEGGSGLASDPYSPVRGKRGSLQKRGTMTKSGTRGSLGKESTKGSPITRKASRKSIPEDRARRESVSLESTMSSTAGFDAK